VSCAGLLLLALSSVPSPASAHVPARVRVAAPADGARVSGDRVRIVLVGEGGSSAATFRLDLDGASVDASGTVGGVFSTVSVLPDKQVVLSVAVAPGAHVLTMTPDADTDSGAPVQVRRFEVIAKQGGGGAGPLVLAGVAVLVALGAGVAFRRRAQ
jgi:hypothetical protein